MSTPAITHLIELRHDSSDEHHTGDAELLEARLGLMQSQLGDAFHSVVGSDPETGSAFVRLHPKASKFALLAIYTSGFNIVDPDMPVKMLL